MLLQKQNITKKKKIKLKVEVVGTVDKTN